MSSPSTSAPSIASITARISELSSQISSYLESTSHPEPSFDVSSAAVPETADYEALRAPLNDAALDLLRLINGPRRDIRTKSMSHFDHAAYQIALDRRFFDLVPLPPPDAAKDTATADAGSGESVKKIAQQAGMDEDRTARVFRMLATQRIFEKVPGEVESYRHTAASALFAQDKDLHAFYDMQMDDELAAVSQTSALIRKSPHASDATNCAFTVAHGMPMYELFRQKPDKGKRFAQAMNSWAQVGSEISDIRKAFPWETLGEGTVVDVGGSNGHISIALAKQYPSLHFVVQDLSTVHLAQAQDSLDADLSKRITFQKHDFYTPQPITNASALLLRQITHNYNDADCIRIFKALVPGMENGAPLLISELVLPEPGTATRYGEHYLLQVDLCMMVLFGAKERSKSEFAEVLRRADERLEIARVWEGGLLPGVVEVRLKTGAET